MKIAIIGGGADFRALKIMLESKIGGIEVFDVYEDELDKDIDDKKTLLATCGGLITPTFKSTSKRRVFNGAKDGSNKSDRKRDRKSRWR